MMLRTEFSGLLTQDLKNPVNLFVGAGFSSLAQNTDGSLPTGDELRRRLIQTFDLERFSSLDLPSLYSVIQSDRREALKNFLFREFSVSKFDPAYDAIRRINTSHIYTTNIDDLCYRIYEPIAEARERLLHDNYVYGAPRSPSEVVQYIALHGSIRHEDSNLIFSAGSISSAFASDRETWYVFQRELQSRPTIFLGYGMKDAGVLQALHDASPQTTNRWILLREADEGSIALYKALGFLTIIGDTKDFLLYVADVLSMPAHASSTDEIVFGKVPRSAEIAQRPIKNFFVGAEPEWSDAYSPQVYHRRANAAVKNSVTLADMPQS